MPNAFCTVNECCFSFDDTDDISFGTDPGTAAAADAMGNINVGMHGFRFVQSGDFHFMKFLFCFCLLFPDLPYVWDDRGRDQNNANEDCQQCILH